MTTREVHWIRSHMSTLKRELKIKRKGKQWRERRREIREELVWWKSKEVETILTLD